MDRYDPQAIESKWQRVWEETQAFEVPNAGTPDAREFYLLEMLPYPSGTLHVGQVRNYTQGDVLAHFHRRSVLSQVIQETFNPRFRDQPISRNVGKKCLQHRGVARIPLDLV